MNSPATHLLTRNGNWRVFLDTSFPQPPYLIGHQTLEILTPR